MFAKNRAESFMKYCNSKNGAKTIKETELLLKTESIVEPCSMIQI